MMTGLTEPRAYIFNLSFYCVSQTFVVSRSRARPRADHKRLKNRFVLNFVGYNMSDMTQRHVHARDIIGMRRRPDPDRSHRFNDDTIARSTWRDGSTVVELHAPAGTVLCFDSGSIHHGTRTGATLYFAGERAQRRLVHGDDFIRTTPSSTDAPPSMDPSGYA
jgi:hypothetical protein